NIPSRNAAPRAWITSLECRVRPTLPTSRRRALWPESESCLQAPSISGDSEALARRGSADLSSEPGGGWHRSAAARRSVRGSQLGVPDLRRLGDRLAGAVRRNGDYAVHIFPAGR